MNHKPVFNISKRLMGESCRLSRILGHILSLAFSHIPRYAAEIK